MLKKQAKKQESLVKDSEKKIEDWKKVAHFLQSDISWLDQFVYLSEKSLPADSMMLTGAPTFTIAPQSGNATIKSQFAATEPEMITEFEENLRINDYAVAGLRSGQNRDPNSRYREVGEVSVDIPPMKLDALVRTLKKPSRVIPDEAPDTPVTNSNDTKSEPTPDVTEKETAESGTSSTETKKGGAS